jgi:hypothetical protein
MSTRPLALFALALCACATKYIAELQHQETASSSSSDGGDGSDASPTTTGDGPGQTVTSGAEESTTTGAPPVECEPDPNAVCGPEPEVTVAAIPPPAPISGGDTPLVTEYDCTITDLEFVDETLSNITLDCGLEFPTGVSHPLPQATFDKLAVDGAVHVMFADAADGNSHAFALSLDGQVISIVMNGTTIDPNPGTAVFAPFTVTAEEDVCLAPCAVPDDMCFSYARQKLDFAVDGQQVASLWASSGTTIDLDGTTYLVEVGVAQGAVAVNPDSSWCDLGGYDAYAFRIADITP